MPPIPATTIPTTVSVNSWVSDYSRGVATDRSRRGRAVTCALTAAAAAAVAVIAAGCTSGSPSAVSAGPWTAPGSSATPTGDPSPAASAVAPASCVTRVYNGMTEAQRVGQLFLVGLTPDRAGPVTAAALEAYHFGSLLLSPTSEGVTALGAATAHMQSLATSPVSGGVRFFIAANQEGGQIQPLTGPGFSVMPSAVTQGTWSVAALRAAASGWGGELKSAGVNLDLAPVMDVVPPGGASTNAPVGQLERDFGSGPAGNGAHGAAFIAGMASAGVATTAKHFPGLGRVTGNTDFTSGVVDSVTTPDDPYLGSFRAAISAGVPFVMVALATYTRIDASRLAVFSPTVMRLLRSELGFGGVIVSDDLGDAAAVASIPAGDRAISFLNAGGDMITSQSLAPAETMAQAVLARTAADAAFRAEVSTAVRHILAAKRAYGLLPC